jgi:hypothetical protein
VFSLGPGVDSSELQERIPAFYEAMGTSLKLTHIVTHGLVHAQILRRSRPRIPNLLLITVLEGAADLVANLVSGRTAVESRVDYAQANREALLQRYAKDLAETPDRTEEWLSNYSRVREEPADLGYWIGEEICRDYLAMASDKQAAVRNIIPLVDPEAIVVKIRVSRPRRRLRGERRRRASGIRW